MTRRIGSRYELRGLLGRTETMRVHRAFDTGDQRDVVIRVFAHVDEGRRKELRRELERRRDVRSACVVPCDAVGESDGIVYTVEPLVDGVSAEERHTTEGPLEISDAVTVGIRVLQGLEDLHGAGITHGAVSTATIQGLAALGPALADRALLASPAAGVKVGEEDAASPEDDVRAAARVVLDLVGDPDDDRDVGARLDALRQRDAALLAGFLAGPLDPDAALPGGARALRTSLALYAHLQRGGGDADAAEGRGDSDDDGAPEDEAPVADEPAVAADAPGAEDAPIAGQHTGVDEDPAADESRRGWLLGGTRGVASTRRRDRRARAAEDDWLLPEVERHEDTVRTHEPQPERAASAPTPRPRPAAVATTPGPLPPLVAADPSSDDLSASLDVLATCVDEDGPLAVTIEYAATAVRPSVSRRLQRIVRALEDGAGLPDAVRRVADRKDPPGATRLLEVIAETPQDRLGQVLRSAAQIVAEESAVHQAAKVLRFEGVTAAVALAATPVAVAGLRALGVSQLVPQVVDGAMRIVGFAVAAGLAVAGAFWLWRALQPPVSAGLTVASRATAKRLRDRDRVESELVNALDATALHILAGSSLAQAMDRVAVSEGTSQRLAQHVDSLQGAPEAATRVADDLVANVARTLVTADSGDAEAAAAAGAVATQLRAGRLQRLTGATQRVPVVAAWPFFVCLLPATVLLLIL